jgi:hypothetical protein
MGRTAPLEILHRAAPCRNVQVTFTLDRICTVHSLLGTISC